MENLLWLLGGLIVGYLAYTLALDAFRKHRNGEG